MIDNNSIPTKPYILAIGGMVADLQGFSHKNIIASESNPGNVSFSAGGVARNIAENLARLDLPVIMLSAVGNDAYGQAILSGSRQSGIDVSRVLSISNCSTASYLAIFDRNRDLAVAIADMQIFDQISVEYLQSNSDLIKNAEIIVLDTNLSLTSLKWLADNCSDKKIFIDPVSQAKAQKIIEFIGNFHTVKPNSNEIETLTGLSANTLEAAEKAGQELIRRGCQQCFISMAEQGVLAITKDETIHLPAPKVQIKSVSGAGDAFMAGLIYGCYHELSLATTATAALKMAALTLQSDLTVSQEINPKQLTN